MAISASSPTLAAGEALQVRRVRLYFHPVLRAAAGFGLRQLAVA
jgi:hypothetical protein